jgi:hypothetical protein
MIAFDTTTWIVRLLEDGQVLVVPVVLTAVVSDA